MTEISRDSELIRTALTGTSLSDSRSLGSTPMTEAEGARPIELRTYRDALSLPGVPRWLRLMLAMAPMVRHGSITITLPDGRIVRATGTTSGPDAALTVRDPRIGRRLLTGGNLSVGEAYIDGDFDSADLAALTEWAVRNDTLDDMLMGKPWFRTLRRVAHAFRSNSKTGSRRNIAHHYDLGNEFYAQWLDPSMTYSAAIYDRPDQDLAEAQAAKYRRLCQSLNLQQDQKVLEIGCGWGGFAQVAATEFGAQVHAITISRAQFEHTSRQIFNAGLNDRVRVELRDYRDIDGTYDRIASIEMLEAVGEKYWPTFFDKLHAALRPGGLVALQVITIADRYFESYRTTMDFIQCYIFPGGMLPSPTGLRQQVERAGLTWRSDTWFGSDYATTLAVWNRQFQAAWPSIRALGFDERFKRMWEYYLAYCEGGFRAGTIDVAQVCVARS